MKSVKIYLLLLTVFAFVKTNGQKELPKEASSTWYNEAIQQIEQTNCSFHISNNNELFKAVNQFNQLAFSIKRGGYEVSSLLQNSDQSPWKASFSLQSIARNGEVAPLSLSPVVTQKNNTLNLAYNNFDIEYINNSKGLRQNFIIKNKQEGTEPLVLKLQVSTSLTVSNPVQGQLIFSNPANQKEVKMIYDGLKVWDANQQPVAASLNYETSSKTIIISVDDQNAAYPLTIDPLNRAPEWTTSADGILPGLLTNLQLQVQTLYGYTVAGLGDINGDGYDDVAVSAPGMADVITGSGSLSAVGAVFIYLGSPTGLSTTPSKILQPNTAVDGALFGFSVDAGDVTGDGKNDIIIGAPLDRYQTTASGLLGPTNVQVTAGKVYVYRSEDLFSAPNPTPFLELRLQGTTYFSTGVLGLLQSNVAAKPLFGFSVAVTKDLNGDNKADILIGTPSYLGVNLLSVQSGAAFIYYSDNLNTTSPAKLNTPDPTLLGLISLPIANTSGLLFGYSIDGAGDFNNDGFPDVVVGAPAGVDLSSLGGVFSGQFLGGSAYVYFGNGSGVNATSTVRLQAKSGGLLSNTANLFGYKVKGATNAFGIKTGNIVIGAPAGSVLSNVVGGLKVKAGEIHIFQKKTAATGAYNSDQIINSPRSSSILGILAGQTLNVSLLYGSSIDNMLDVNCDNIGDIIVGEPLSTAVPLIGANVVGGAAYVYLGKADGTYNTTPIWDLYSQVSSLLGVNATALLGYSVAGARHTRGIGQSVRSLVGGPSNSLDFGVGLLNLGNTLGITFDFAFDNNGLGKAYTFPFTTCNALLPVNLLSFNGYLADKMIQLNWTSATEDGLDVYELQRSTDAVNYVPIAMIMPLSKSTNNYQYPDRHPAKGMNYYRLKMIDKDKKFTYSNIVAIRFDEQLAADIVIAPNPVHSEINIRMTGLTKGLYRIELVNASGQNLMAKSIMVNQYLQTETIQRNSLAAGIYWVYVYDNEGHKVNSLRVLINNF